MWFQCWASVVDLPNVVLMFGQRRSRWPNIKKTSGSLIIPLKGHINPYTAKHDHSRS